MSEMRKLFTAVMEAFIESAGEDVEVLKDLQMEAQSLDKGLHEILDEIEGTYIGDSDV